MAEKRTISDLNSIQCTARNKEDRGGSAPSKIIDLYFPFAFIYGVLTINMEVPFRTALIK